LVTAGGWTAAGVVYFVENVYIFTFFIPVIFFTDNRRRMEQISWTDRVRNEEELLTVKEQRNILHEISKRKANWIGHILRRNCLLQRVIEGKIKGGIELTGNTRKKT